MSYFNIIYIFAFLPVVIILYNIIPKKLRPVLLLIASYLFFFDISGKLIIFLILSSLSIYFSALLMKKIDKVKEEKITDLESEEKRVVKEKYKRLKRTVLVVTILFNLSFLFFFKYLNFFGSIVNGILDILKINYSFKLIKLLAPIGISFYTLQAISYLVDVYNGKVEASDSLLKVLLYLSFFPIIMEGPITRFSSVCDSLLKGEKTTYNSICLGYQRILFGMFKKFVIADRLNIFVKLTFGNYRSYSSLVLALGAIFYTILLYMEFSGTMDVVIGSAEIFNIKLEENFKAPFFSKNISEFWSRWHISLGLWLKNYIFYPVSMSKFVKKITAWFRKLFGSRVATQVMGSMALFAVWSLNGLWHGAGWTFVVFGYYHLILILLGNIFEPTVIKVCKKLKINRDNKFYKFLRIIKTCCLVVIGELIFRAPSLSVAFGMLGKIFTKFSLKGFSSEVLSLGLDVCDFLVVILGVVVVFVVSLLNEKGKNVRERISQKNIFVRWAFYYALILGIILLGAYGPGYAPVDPIYADF